MQSSNPGPGMTPSSAQALSTSEKSLRERLKRFYWPILVLVMQFALLVATISFIAWSWKSHSIKSISNKLEYGIYSLYPQYPTVLTLFGSILSVTTTYLFTEAVRFAIHVRLKQGDLSLYKLYAASAISSKSPLLDFNRGRAHWAVISIVSCVIFLVQTSAWTTIITPNTHLSHLQPGEFLDFDFSTPVLTNGTFGTILPPLSTFLRAAASGMAATQDIAKEEGFLGATSLQTNVSRFLPYSDFVLNGTSYGIIPQFPQGITSNELNSYYITTVQQGLTADVSCVETPDSVVQISDYQSFTLNITEDRTGYDYQAGIFECANGTQSNTNQTSPFTILDADPQLFGLFTTCPSNDGETIPFYLQIGGNWIGIDPSSGTYVTVNMTCSIKPQVLNVSVAYNDTGYVTLGPQTSTKRPLNLDSSAISTIMAALNYHLYVSQAPDTNIAIEGIYGIYGNSKAYQVSDYGPLASLMAAYIRGVIEDAATNLRYALFQLSDSNQVPRQPVQAMIYQNFVTWGPASPRHKMIIVAAPLLVMLSTIVIISVAFYWGWSLDWKGHDMSFNSTSIIHLIVAWSSIQQTGLGSLDFTGYDKEKVYGMSEDVTCSLSVDEGLGARRQGLKVEYAPKPRVSPTNGVLPQVSPTHGVLPMGSTTVH